MYKKQSLSQAAINCGVHLQHKRTGSHLCLAWTYSGGSQVFQRRVNGSVDFYRDWNDYKNGFGSVNGEFWLGNDHIHSLTCNDSYILRIDMEAFNGTTRFAEYVGFSVDDESTYYTLRFTAYRNSSTARECNRSGSIIRFTD